MKILNLYSGIGGNRKLWGDEHNITAVEYDKNIAAVYKSYFPDDNIVVGDAHEYLLKNYKDYDFIWSSPPCTTHSRLRFLSKDVVYPDMKLYQEIILLKTWFKGLFVVENVIPYYDTLIKPDFELHRHYLWSNFYIGKKEFKVLHTGRKLKEKDFLEKEFDYNLDNFTGIDKRKVLRNCVVPEMGLYILNCALNIKSEKENNLFNM